MELRPTGTSAQNWSPAPERDSRLNLEWIARGLTAKSFWTAPWRWIMALEGCALVMRCDAPLGLSRPESE